MKLLILLTLSVPVDSIFWEPLDSLIAKGLNYAYAEKYKEAHLYFDLAIRNYPENPIGYLYKAALLDLYMIDFETDIYENMFYMYADSAIYKASRIRMKPGLPKDSVALYYFVEGSAYAYKAIRKGRNKEYISALNYGKKSIELLKKSLEYDSTLYDAYLPLGVFEFAMTKAPGILKIFVPEDYSREEAIRKIELSINKSKYLRTYAENAYTWVLLYDNQADSAIKIAEKLVSEYPSSRTFRWTLSYCQRKLGKWAEALKNHEVILYLTLRDQPWNYYNVALSLYYLSICSYVVGDKRRSLFYARQCADEMKKAPDGKPLKDRIIRVAQNLSQRLEKYQGDDLFVDPKGVEKYVIP